MAGALETVDAYHIHADALRRQGVAHGYAFVDDLYTCGLETLHEGLRAAAGGFDDLDPAVDDDVHVVVVIDFRGHHSHRQVDAEGLVRQRPAFLDLRPQALGGGLGKGRHHPQGPGIGGRGRQLGGTDAHHTAANDRCFDAE